MGREDILKAEWAAKFIRRAEPNWDDVEYNRAFDDHMRCFRSPPMPSNDPQPGIGALQEARMAEYRRSIEELSGRLQAQVAMTKANGVFQPASDAEVIERFNEPMISESNMPPTDGGHRIVAHDRDSADLLSSMLDQLGSEYRVHGPDRGRFTFHILGTRPGPPMTEIAPDFILCPDLAAYNRSIRENAARWQGKVPRRLVNPGQLHGSECPTVLVVGQMYLNAQNKALVAEVEARGGSLSFPE